MANNPAANLLSNASSNAPFMNEWANNETVAPDTFSQGSVGPGYMNNLTLPPSSDASDVPWSLHGDTFPPNFQEGGTLPPWLLENGTLPPWLFENGSLAPGMWQNGTLDVGLINQDWTKDLQASFEKLKFDVNVTVDPIFLPKPAVEFQRSPASNMAGIPRFGFRNDVAVLGMYMSGEGSSEPTEYIIGLTILSGIMLGIYLVWGSLLCIFKCSCKGALGGRPFVQPPRRKNDVGMWARLVFFVAALLMIVFTILFVVKGMEMLDDTRTSIEVVSLSTRDIMMESTSVSRLLNSLRDMISTVHGEMATSYKNPCPGLEAIDSSELGNEMDNAFESAMKMLLESKTDITKASDTLEKGTVSVGNGIDKCDAVIQDSKDYEMIGQFIALPFLALTGMLLVGVVAADRRVMPRGFECFLSWVILPLFIFFTIISFVLCNVMLVSARANADFCGGKDSTPDQNLLDFLVKSETFLPDEYLFKAAEYYVHQCTDHASEDPLLPLRNGIGSLERMDQALASFLGTMTETTIDKISFGCQKDFGPLVESMKAMQGAIDLAQKSADAIFLMMDCDRLAKVYAELVYDAGCTHTLEGFTWTFSCLLTVSFMGMIMISLRSSYQKTIFSDDEAKLLQDSDENLTKGDGSTMTDKKREKRPKDNESERDSESEKGNASERGSDLNEDRSLQESQPDTNVSSLQDTQPDLGAIVLKLSKDAENKSDTNDTPSGIRLKDKEVCGRNVDQQLDISFQESHPLQNTSVFVPGVPSDYDLYGAGWAKHWDTERTAYYYYRIDGSQGTTWENPLAQYVLGVGKDAVNAKEPEGEEKTRGSSDQQTTDDIVEVNDTSNTISKGRRRRRGKKKIKTKSMIHKATPTNIGHKKGASMPCAA